jgi:hypothetical protein
MAAVNFEWDYAWLVRSKSSQFECMRPRDVRTEAAGLCGIEVLPDLVDALGLHQLWPMLRAH